ncbi:MAG: hypothetical protein H0U49_01210 [Parachlamydiaceae bacterium]|nr:hypothetical protein [Parachlamydiaceae bacterium]
MKQTFAEKIFRKTPQQIRQDLQDGRSDDLSRRRMIVALAFLGIASMIVVSPKWVSFNTFPIYQEKFLILTKSIRQTKHTSLEYQMEHLS